MKRIYKAADFETGEYYLVFSGSKQYVLLTDHWSDNTLFVKFWGGSPPSEQPYAYMNKNFELYSPNWFTDHEVYHVTKQKGEMLKDFVYAA